MTTSGSNLGDQLPEIFRRGDKGYEGGSRPDTVELAEHAPGTYSPRDSLLRDIPPFASDFQSSGQRYKHEPVAELIQPVLDSEASAEPDAAPHPGDNPYYKRQLTGMAIALSASFGSVVSFTKYHENHQLYGGTGWGLGGLAVAGLAAVFAKGKAPRK